MDRRIGAPLRRDQNWGRLASEGSNHNAHNLVSYTTVGTLVHRPVDDHGTLADPVCLSIIISPLGLVHTRILHG